VLNHETSPFQRKERKISSAQQLGRHRTVSQKQPARKGFHLKKNEELVLQAGNIPSWKMHTTGENVKMRGLFPTSGSECFLLGQTHVVDPADT